MILLLDNYDSFTYNLLDYLQQCGAECMVVRNDEKTIDELSKLSFDAIVLSPGPKKPADAGIMMNVIDHFHQNIPILGICLGHQGIGEYFGAMVVKADVPMHGKISLVEHNGHPLFESISSPFEVMRYHSLLVKEIKNTPLEVISTTSLGEIMAVAHPDLNILGVQFHPESILTAQGLQLIDNWLKIIN